MKKVSVRLFAFFVVVFTISGVNCLENNSQLTNNINNNTEKHVIPNQIQKPSNNNVKTCKFVETECETDDDCCNKNCRRSISIVKKYCKVPVLKLLRNALPLFPKALTNNVNLSGPRFFKRAAVDLIMHGYLNISRRFLRIFGGKNNTVMCVYNPIQNPVLENVMNTNLGPSAGNRYLDPYTRVVVTVNETEAELTINERGSDGSDILMLTENAAHNLGLVHPGNVTCELYVPFWVNHSFIRRIVYIIPIAGVLYLLAQFNLLP